MTTNQTSPAPLPALTLQPLAYTAVHWLLRDDDDPFDLDAPYQRGEVWTVDQQRNLIRSLKMGLPVGNVVAAKLPYNTPGKYVRIIDGKQRITAIRAWADGSLDVPAWWFADEDLREEVRPLRRLGDGARVTFRDQSERGRRDMMTWHMPCLEFNSGSEATRTETGWTFRNRSQEEMIQAEAEVYLLVNFGGVPQTDDDRARAETIAGGVS